MFYRRLALLRNGYQCGVLWMCLASFISSFNDVVMRHTGNHLPPFEVVFFRFIFSLLALMPFTLKPGVEVFRTKFLGLHMLRSVLGFIAITIWCIGVTIAPLVIASVLALTVPIFVLLMSSMFLKEVVDQQRITSTFVGFVGVLVILLHDWTRVSFDLFHRVITRGTCLLIIASILFAASDVLNKRVINRRIIEGVKESNLTILLYFSLGTSVCGLIPACITWVKPTLSDLALLMVLGLGGNLILFCLLKAFSLASISSLSLYRYTELIFTGILGNLLYHEIPSTKTLIGSALIVLSTFSLATYELKSQKD